MPIIRSIYVDSVKSEFKKISLSNSGKMDLFIDENKLLHKELIVSKTTFVTSIV